MLPDQKVVVTQPTELIVTDSSADLVALPGTDLLYVKNTVANVFLELTGRELAP